jgi:hypothetical protein
VYRSWPSGRSRRLFSISTSLRIRGHTQLAAKTDVSVVFNKSRSYGPKWLEGEL